MDADPTAPVVCPPHHWLIVAIGTDRQQWTCQRCEARQEHDAAVLYRWPGGRPTGLPKKLKHPGD
jgi:hypothetical protein